MSEGRAPSVEAWRVRGGPGRGSESERAPGTHEDDMGLGTLEQWVVAFDKLEGAGSLVLRSVVGPEVMRVLGGSH